MPHRQEARELLLLDGLDPRPQRRQGAAAQDRQQVRAHILHRPKVWPTVVTGDQVAGADLVSPHGADAGHGQAIAVRKLFRGGDDVGLGPTHHQPREGIQGTGHRWVGQAGGDRNAQRVAQQPRVVSNGQHRDAGDPEGTDATGCQQLVQPGPGQFGVVAGRPALDLGQGAGGAQHVPELFGAGSTAELAAAAQFLAEGHDHIGVQELCAALATEQLGQQRRIQAECGELALGQGLVAVVDELSDVAEHQRLGEGGCLGGLDLDQTNPSCRHVTEQCGQPREVEDVLETFAHGLEDDREVGVVGRDGQQLRRPHALLPQR